jgi:hypothetical protein
MNAQTLFEAEDLEAIQQGLTSYACPCMCCHGAWINLSNTIKRHMRQYGHDPYFQWPMVVWHPLTIC